VEEAGCQMIKTFILGMLDSQLEKRH
jgi:hypothetical protein